MTKEPADDDTRGDTLHELARAAAARLGEHFDTVLVIGTHRDSQGNSGRVTVIDGDDYAAYGAAKAFVCKFEGAAGNGER